MRCFYPIWNCVREPENFKIIENLRRDYEAILKQILRLGVQKKQMQLDDIHVSAMAILAM